MVRRYAAVGAAMMSLGCRAGTEPVALPAGPADFLGTITQVKADGGYLVDDGSASACGFSVVYVSDTTEIWWRTGAPADVDKLQIGRRVSAWKSGGDDPRCSTLQARAIVIETMPLTFP